MQRIPKIAGPYIHVYKPQPDVFPGPDSAHFRAGARYEEWTPNDFSVLRGPDGRWHALGITHPSAVDQSAGNIHEAEWQAFHCASEIGTLREALAAGSWHDLPKVLPAPERPGEIRLLYAPFIVEKDGVYHMIYGPQAMRWATSRDLTHWTPRGTLFEGHPSTRDPHVCRVDDRFVMTYVVENAIFQRVSEDLVHWSETPHEIFHMTSPGMPESPVLARYEEYFYLFWCIYDGTHGPYDARTYVCRSDTPGDFQDRAPIAELAAHAPEILIGEDGSWYLASAEWPHRGVSIAPLAWE